MIFNLPIKPLSINAAFQGRRFKTKECNQYCKDVMTLLPKGKLTEGLVEVRYLFCLTNWKMTDGDNLVKVLQDCIVKAKLISDDRKIMRYVIEKWPAKENSIVVEIVPYNQTARACGIQAVPADFFCSQKAV